MELNNNYFPIWIYEILNNFFNLFQILCEKNCNHILMLHLIGRWWCDNKKDDIVFSFQILFHIASMIYDKMTRIFKIPFENLTRIKEFQIWLKNNYANDVNNMMCHYIDNVFIQLFYNDWKMIVSNLIWP
jgi:hypothetical protein